MAGTRDVLVHAYFGVNLGVVWKTVIESLPVLIPGLQRVLETLELEEEGGLEGPGSA